MDREFWLAVCMAATTTGVVALLIFWAINRP